MSNQIYTFNFSPDWMLLTKQISQIDRFDASWAAIEKSERQTLKQLKSIATVRSVGSSTRIEGSTMTDDEVGALIENLSVSKLEERDQQEVAGYFEVLELIADSFRDIEITESNLKHLHNTLMRYSDKDAWHKRNYKQHSNVVGAKNIDSSKQVIFKTAEPGFATEDAMRDLIGWYRADMQTHVLIKAALFVYGFLSVHPFQDGNGRLSRLLGTLLLLKHGYSWVQYVSFEHEIENRKSEYYKVLMQCQRHRPGEEVYPWVLFFLDCLKNIQSQLQAKLEVQTTAENLPRREKQIYSFIENHPASKSGEISEKLNIPLSSVKRLLKEMVNSKILAKNGIGVGINYKVAGTASIKKDLAMVFTNKLKKKEFTIVNQSSFIRIKKIILTPLFNWSHPNEWGVQLAKNVLYLQVTCSSSTGFVIKQPYAISSYNTGYDFNPVFSLRNPIEIPEILWEKTPDKKDYPVSVSIELLGSSPDFAFDVMLVYDEA